jgi:hypothetical protein
MTVHKQLNSFWHPKQLEPGDFHFWQAGTLQLWAKRAPEHEWRIATSRAGEELNEISSGEDPPPPSDAAWKRWAFKEEDATLHVLPAMPDMPVVARPDSPVRIPRGNEITFFVSIPFFLQAHVGPANEIFIYEEPTVVLSKTWFGEPTGGELSYALRTSASRDLQGIKPGQHRVVCPVIVRNRSTEELNFQKICIRSMHVNIHAGATRLWTEEIEVTYLGQNSFSEVTFGKEPPAYEPTLGVLAPARETLARNFLKKSFSSLLSL